MPRNDRKILSICNAPSILLIQLNRFGFDGKKSTKNLSTEQKIVLSGFSYDSDTHLEYNLVSAVCHIGVCTDSGHYIALCRTNGGYYIFDDTKVSPISDITKYQHYFLWIM